MDHHGEDLAVSSLGFERSGPSRLAFAFESCRRDDDAFKGSEVDARD
jgi:hypothetical protein